MIDSKNLKFDQSVNGDFLSVLRTRINEYLDSQNRTRFGNWNMVLKTIFMFLLYFSPYFLMLFGVVTAPLLVFVLWIVMGMGMAGIGLSVMHDANHGSYSSKKWVNKLLATSMNLIGANSEIWKLQHNVLHHTYTNINGYDEDLNSPKILRFSPHNKRYGIHKYQFLYAWFLYGIATLSWTTLKEFVQLYRYRKIGLIKSKSKFRFIMTELYAYKVLYYIYILVIPLLFFSIPAWVIIVSFFAMHFTAGLILSLIFQTAHVMPECKYPLPVADGGINNSWAVHELETTSNFAPRSRIFSWLIGGLNYQNEHHLFPKICHIHYKSISKIVASTAKEFNVPYNSQETFLTAIWNHAKMLYYLGRMEMKAA